ncbi:hypothetical protein NQ318_009664 [Aromia moschata]|uniref:Uncharacterized protein n=1 Tax=Aromia moschata TaxID=1265417 RepID=A0AAV8XYW1_9CUCU|nr:hypothetical protein NQ318_009664 [Aromia moschata]
MDRKVISIVHLDRPCESDQILIAPDSENASENVSPMKLTIMLMGLLILKDVNLKMKPRSKEELYKYPMNRNYSVPEPTTHAPLGKYELSNPFIRAVQDITKTIVHEIVTESLGMRKVCAKLVPKVLTDQNRALSTV